MPRVRMGDRARKLRGTYEASRNEASAIRGRVALTEILPPPDDLDPLAQREWRIHIIQAIGAGTVGHVNLAAFRALTEAAALRSRAYRRALREGPVRSTAAGSTKSNAAWVAFLAADTNYQRWMAAFGLTPKSAANLPRLPVAGSAQLQVV
jgi:hypothetical protein